MILSFMGSERGFFAGLLRVECLAQYTKPQSECVHPHNIKLRGRADDASFAICIGKA